MSLFFFYIYFSSFVLYDIHYIHIQYSGSLTNARHITPKQFFFFFIYIFLYVLYRFFILRYVAV